MSPSIYLHDAHLQYAGNCIFKQLSLTLLGGHVTSLLGPSGVGKTSLLLYIAGLINQTSNYILEGEISTSDKKPLQGRIAYMSQSDCLMPWLTIEENILLGARLRHTYQSSDKQRVALLLKRLQLKDIAGSYPSLLSGGMRGRVAIARTLFEDRPIVLLDEPFSSLDAITTYELQAELSSALKGKTVLLITHDPSEAIRLGDYIYVMSGRPAIIKEPIELSDPTPRAMKDERHFSLQSILLASLTQAKEGLL